MSVDAEQAAAEYREHCCSLAAALIEVKTHLSRARRFAKLTLSSTGRVSNTRHRADRDEGLPEPSTHLLRLHHCGTGGLFEVF